MPPSLSSLIGDSRTPVTERLMADFPMPKLPPCPALVAPSICENPTKVGIAYDYLFRFFLMRECQFAKTYPWIAERALEEVLESTGGTVYFSDGEAVAADDIADSLESYIFCTKDALKRFVAGQSLTARLNLMCLCLAEADIFQRLFVKHASVRERPSLQDYRDLRRIIAATDFTQFKPANYCLLNPSFGPEGASLIQADADLVLDDLLIDVKTSKGFLLRPKFWHQLLGYAALNLHFPIGGGAPVPIRRVGLFYARYNRLVSWNLHDVVDADKFAAFADWFRGYLIERKEEEDATFNAPSPVKRRRRKRPKSKKRKRAKASKARPKRARAP